MKQRMRELQLELEALKTELSSLRESGGVLKESRNAGGEDSSSRAVSDQIK